MYFYPRSPCGERHTEIKQFSGTKTISIHALLAESDLDAAKRRAGEIKFLSTLSLRRATRRGICPTGYFIISIHALLAESDSPKCVLPWMTLNFYPRSPCGERPTFIVYSITGKYISIHALLAESDSQCRTFASGMYGFLSTLSLRRATM